MKIPRRHFITSATAGLASVGITARLLTAITELHSALPDDRRVTMATRQKAIRKAAPKLAPFLTSGMGPTPILGYGKCHYKSARGREGDCFTVRLIATKSRYAVHI